MATNCPQHVKPRACRSAYVRFTSAWNSVRGNRLRSWLNMLENRVTGEPPWWWRVEACRPRHHHTPRGLTRSQTLIWTRVVRDIKKQYHVRRLWDFDEDAVYVTDESGYQKLSLGQKVVPVGFPRQDVFE